MSGMEVVKRWHVREAFDDMTWGGYGRGKRIGTGKGSRDQRRVIMRDSASKGWGGKVVVDMASDVAHWIRGWLPQYVIPISGGGGESCWGRIGILMKCNVNVANQSQDIDRHQPIVVIPHFENDLIPESTEVVLQFR